MRNFKALDSDYDYRVFQRIIEGRLTKRRYEILSKFIRQKNNSFKYPYGTSPNGYAYNCGCEHDCCGCLSGEHIKAEFTKDKIVITHSQSFNY